MRLRTSQASQHVAKMNDAQNADELLDNRDMLLHTLRKMCPTKLKF